MRALLVISSLILAACADSHSVDVRDRGLGIVAARSVYVFGDSIGVGTGANVGYADRTVSKLGLSPAQNLSVGSTRIADQNQLPLILSKDLAPGSIVLFLTGMNDITHNGDDPELLKVYLEKLEQIMDRFEEQEVEAFIGLPLRLDYDGLEYFAILKYPLTAYTSVYYANSIYKLYLTKNYKHVHMVDTHYGYAPDRTNNADGIHPNDVGAEIIANIFVDTIRRTL